MPNPNFPIPRKEEEKLIPDSWLILISFQWSFPPLPVELEWCVCWSLNFAKCFFRQTGSWPDLLQRPAPYKCGWSLKYIYFLGQPGADQNKENNKIFKSLFAIMAFVVGSFWACCVLGLLSKQIDDEFFKLYVYLTVTQTLAMCASTFNAPILIIFRSDSLKWNSKR